MKRKKINLGKINPKGKGKQSYSEFLDSVSLLTKELGNPDYKEPTPEEIEALEKTIIDGNEEEKEEARNKLFRRSLKYISKLAWSKVNYNPQLYQELFARVALRALEGLKEWDPREKSFSRYIERIIDQQMENWVEQNKKEKKHMSFNFDTSTSTDQEYNENEQEEKRFAISDGNKVSEEEAECMMHEWIQKYYESIERLKSCTKEILNARHHKFLSEALDHGLILQLMEGWFDSDLKKSIHKSIDVRVAFKKGTYAEIHLGWYIPILENEFGKRVKQWSKGKILRKFTNTFNYVWHKVAQEVDVLIIFSQILFRLEYLLPPGASSLAAGGPIFKHTNSEEEQHEYLRELIPRIEDDIKNGISPGRLLISYDDERGDSPYLVMLFDEESFKPDQYVIYFTMDSVKKEEG